MSEEIDSYSSSLESDEFQGYPDLNGEGSINGETERGTAGKRIAQKTAKQIKSHKKSRNGCSVCKERRVKCDEAKPRCSNCEMRNEKCLYVEPSKITRARRKIAKMRSIGVQTDDFFAPDSSNDTNNNIHHLNSTPEIKYSFSTEHSVGSSTTMQTTEFSETPLSSMTASDIGASIGGGEDLMKNAGEQQAQQQPPRQPPQQLSFELPSSLLPKASGFSSSYLEATRLNNKLLSYYQTIYSTFLSSNAEVQTKWKQVGWLIHEVDFVYFIAVSNLYLHFYYKCISRGTNTEDYLQLPGLKDYLHYAEMNYQKFLDTMENNHSLPPGPKTFAVFASVRASHALNFFLSPSKTLLDPKLWDISKKIKESLSTLASIEPSALAEYYLFESNSHFADSQDLYKPSYLFDLCNLISSERHRETIRKSITSLIKEYYKLSQAPDPLQIMFSFLMRAEPQFVDLIEKRDSFAIVVFCHYLMLVHAFDLKILSKFCLVDEFKKFESILYYEDQNLLPWIDVPRRAIYREII